MRLTAVTYFADRPNGWTPIELMIDLCARCFGAQQTRIAPRPRISAARKLGLMLAPVARGDEQAELYVARFPRDIVKFIDAEGFRRPGRRRVLWIVDSYLRDWLPPAPVLRKFDVIGFTQHADQEFYRDLTGERALWLGWGTDALDSGSPAAERRVDVMRVGRQSEGWDDDAATAAACAAQGLSFAGRPPGLPGNDAEAHRALLRDHYRSTRFLLASSNLAGPPNYTSLEREYITARWTDALGCGAVVAGVPPRSDLALIDWPGALLDFGEIDFAANLAQLREAADAWTPDVARRNHLEALRRLDWRWRFKAIADKLGLVSPGLEAELDRLRARIEEVEAGLSTPAR